MFINPTNDKGHPLVSPFHKFCFSENTDDSSFSFLSTALCIMPSMISHINLVLTILVQYKENVSIKINTAKVIDNIGEPIYLLC